MRMQTPESGGRIVTVYRIDLLRMEDHEEIVLLSIQPDTESRRVQMQYTNNY